VLGNTPPPLLQELGLSAQPRLAARGTTTFPSWKFPDGTTRENATYDGVTIKQADANLLALSAQKSSPTSPDIRKDLAYYEPRMAPDGPAMGNSVLAALHARLGDAEKAYQMFQKSYQPNEVPPFGVLAETAGGTNPYFATGAGGMLQAATHVVSADWTSSDAGHHTVKNQVALPAWKGH
jgi:hypothetical protein